MPAGDPALFDHALEEFPRPVRASARLQQLPEPHEWLRTRVVPAERLVLFLDRRLVPALVAGPSIK